MGKRALDGGNTDGRYCTVPITDYIKHANSEVPDRHPPDRIARGLAQVEAIAAVPGFDGFLFGPGDFSHRIGKAGQLLAPEVTAARQRVGAARAHGKFVMAAGLYAPFAELVADGHNVFNLGSDVGGLTTWFSQRLELLKNNVTALPASAKSNPYG
jgi:4-hydroxy-2-oxoheptanedioate aldolase